MHVRVAEPRGAAEAPGGAWQLLPARAVRARGAHALTGPPGGVLQRRGVVPRRDQRGLRALRRAIHRRRPAWLLGGGALLAEEARAAGRRARRGGAEVAEEAGVAWTCALAGALPRGAVSGRGTRHDRRDSSRASRTCRGRKAPSTEDPSDPQRRRTRQPGTASAPRPRARNSAPQGTTRTVQVLGWRHSVQQGMEGKLPPIVRLGSGCTSRPGSSGMRRPTCMFRRGTLRRGIVVARDARGSRARTSTCLASDGRCGCPPDRRTQSPPGFDTARCSNPGGCSPS